MANVKNASLNEFPAQLLPAITRLNCQQLQQRTDYIAYVRAKPAGIDRLGFTFIRRSIGAQDRDRCAIKLNSTAGSRAHLH